MPIWAKFAIPTYEYTYGPAMGPPLPQGEGWGEGIKTNTVTATYSPAFGGSDRSACWGALRLPFILCEHKCPLGYLRLEIPPAALDQAQGGEPGRLGAQDARPELHTSETAGPGALDLGLAQAPFRADQQGHVRRRPGQGLE